MIFVKYADFSERVAALQVYTVFKGENLKKKSSHKNDGVFSHGFSVDGAHTDIRYKFKLSRLT